MLFHEKLSFLIDTCQVSNKVLSSRLNVDPSLISLLKNGKRRKPHNSDYLYAMADLFSKSVHTDYQRNVLADTIGDPDINIMFDESDLCSAIFTWLDEPESGLKRKYSRPSPAGKSTNPSAQETRYRLCYTAAEKRSAMQMLLELLTRAEKVPTLYLSFNESLSWLTEDQSFAEAVCATLYKLLANGTRIVQIYSSFTEKKESLKFLDIFFPLFGSGRLSIYFCPYLRYSITHHTLVVAPDIAAMASHSTERQKDAASLLTTDPQLISSYLNEFQNYLSYCSPMFSFYKSTTSLAQGLHETLFYSGTYTIMSPALSCDTLPLQLMIECQENAIGPGQREYIARYLQDTPQFIKRLEHCTVMDIARLPPAEEIQAGKVPIVLSQGFTDPPIMYTAESFALHLKNLVWLLEHYENYHFVPYSSDLPADFSVVSQEHMHVMFTRTSPPYISCRITHPEVMENIQNYMMYRIKQLKYAKKDRKTVIERLKRLITELTG